MLGCHLPVPIRVSSENALNISRPCDGLTLCPISCSMLVCFGPCHVTLVFFSPARHCAEILPSKAPVEHVYVSLKHRQEPRAQPELFHILTLYAICVSCPSVTLFILALEAKIGVIAWSCCVLSFRLLLR